LAVYCGWDIGGVHLKLSQLSLGCGAMAPIRSRVVPFEIWRDPGSLETRLRDLLKEITADPGARHAVAGHALTMTAELSDAFATRDDGVRAILAAAGRALRGASVRVLRHDGGLIPLAEAGRRPADVAAANWMATARLAALAAGSGPAILIDVGSTTADIIPLVGGRPAPAGHTDMERLASGELVYSGLLRTPPSSFVSRVPLAGGWCRVSPEHFTQTADVYRLLGRIGEAQYTVPTPDGRGKGREDSAARLARLVCSDPGALGPEAIEALARFLEDRQIDQLADGVEQALSRDPMRGTRRAIVAGAGAFLAEGAARRAGLRPERLSHLLEDHLVGEGWDAAAPSAALAILLAEACGEPWAATILG